MFEWLVGIGGFILNWFLFYPGQINESDVFRPKVNGSICV